MTELPPQFDPDLPRSRIPRTRDTLLVVVGSQMAHAPISVAEGIDFLVFSGHKPCAPGSPGVLLGRRDLLPWRDGIRLAVCAML